MDGESVIIHDKKTYRDLEDTKPVRSSPIMSSRIQAPKSRILQPGSTINSSSSNIPKSGLKMPSSVSNEIQPNNNSTRKISPNAKGMVKSKSNLEVTSIRRKSLSPGPRKVSRSPSPKGNITYSPKFNMKSSSNLNPQDSVPLSPRSLQKSKMTMASSKLTPLVAKMTPVDGNTCVQNSKLKPPGSKLTDNSELPKKLAHTGYKKANSASQLRLYEVASQKVSDHKSKIAQTKQNSSVTPVSKFQYKSNIAAPKMHSTLGAKNTLPCSPGAARKPFGTKLTPSVSKMAHFISDSDDSTDSDEASDLVDNAISSSSNITTLDNHFPQSSDNHPKKKNIGHFIASIPPPDSTLNDSSHENNCLEVSFTSRKDQKLSLVKNKSISSLPSGELITLPNTPTSPVSQDFPVQRRNSFLQYQTHNDTDTKINEINEQLKFDNNSIMDSNDQEHTNQISHETPNVELHANLQKDVESHVNSYSMLEEELKLHKKAMKILGMEESHGNFIISNEKVLKVLGVESMDALLTIVRNKSENGCEEIERKTEVETKSVEQSGHLFEEENVHYIDDEDEIFIEEDTEKYIVEEDRSLTPTIEESIDEVNFKEQHQNSHQEKKDDFAHFTEIVKRNKTPTPEDFESNSPLPQDVENITLSQDMETMSEDSDKTIVYDDRTLTPSIEELTEIISFIDNTSVTEEQDNSHEAIKRKDFAHSSEIVNENNSPELQKSESSSVVHRDEFENIPLSLRNRSSSLSVLHKDNRTNILLSKDPQSENEDEPVSPNILTRRARHGSMPCITGMIQSNMFLDGYDEDRFQSEEEQEDWEIKKAMKVLGIEVSHGKLLIKNEKALKVLGVESIASMVIKDINGEGEGYLRLEESVDSGAELDVKKNKFKTLSERIFKRASLKKKKKSKKYKVAPIPENPIEIETNGTRLEDGGECPVCDPMQEPAVTLLEDGTVCPMCEPMQEPTSNMSDDEGNDTDC
ncbi:unnamed protein product, partial [Meganyctiphanes norvegica]